MANEPRVGPAPRLRFFASLLLTAALLALYLLRPDAMQAAHWWPMAFATPLVFLPFLTLRPRRLLRSFAASLLLWGAALHLVREPSALLVLPTHPKAPGEFRVVSLNCAAGTLDAAREAFAQGADLVLLQEVGEREAFVGAARAAGYPFVAWGVDGSVFSRRPLDAPIQAMDFAAATVELGGRRLRVASLRLLPPVFRLDLWSPDCWEAYAADVRARRLRMADLLAEANATGPCLVGGDFNATNPRIVADARPDWREAGRDAGRGWRGTGTNDYPFVWTDQIWASPAIRWTQAFVRKTQNSDHRMVVADFVFVR